MNLFAEFTVSTTFVVFACIAMLLQAIYILVTFFGRSPKYRINVAGSESVTSEQFLWNLEAITDAKLNRCNKIEVFTNGNQFYEAELQAIAAAKKNINLEAYTFQRSDIAKRYVEALVERARAGTKGREGWRHG